MGARKLTTNERADCLSDQAAELMQQERAPVELPAAAAVCKRQARESWERRENSKATGARDPLDESHMEEGDAEREGEIRRSREGV